MITDAGVGADRSPDRSSNSSDWPLPATPATAVTSPLRTSRETLCSVTPKGLTAGSETSVTVRVAGPEVSRASLFTDCTSAPTMSRASDAAVSARGSRSATTRP